MTMAPRAVVVAVALTCLHVTFTGERPLALRAKTPAQSAIDAVLARAAAYADRYLEVMSNLTVDEHYVQNLAGVRPMVSTSVGAAQTTQRRQLRSDIVLIRIGPPFEWRVYRDVFEVDGRPVRDRADRLERLLLEPASSARTQAERIAEESARFNISNLGRVLNEPGLPLLFLQHALQERFRFTIGERERGNVHVLAYQEVDRPTLFWHNRTIENPSAGRFWIDMLTGEVTRTEHRVSPSGFRATFTTLFRHDERFGVALPTEMREELSTGVQADARKVTGVARYSNYRRFAVAVN
jgi:hypothetical protein